MPQGKKNILLLMTDQLNPDYVSYSAAAKCHTPNIDRIAEGTGFANAVTTNPVCLLKQDVPCLPVNTRIR